MLNIKYSVASTSFRVVASLLELGKCVSMLQVCVYCLCGCALKSESPATHKFNLQLENVMVHLHIGGCGVASGSSFQSENEIDCCCFLNFDCVCLRLCVVCVRGSAAGRCNCNIATAFTQQLSCFSQIIYNSQWS
jgi:hypothetical protein